MLHNIDYVQLSKKMYHYASNSKKIPPKSEQENRFVEALHKAMKKGDNHEKN